MIRNIASRRGRATVLTAALLSACTSAPASSGPLSLTTAAAGADTRVTLVAAPGLKVNARLAPALELADGTVLRFSNAHLTADSSYFAEPPTTLLRGRRGTVHGTLRASVCRENEQVCRTLTLEL
jgi:hypothetical protein